VPKVLSIGGYLAAAVLIVLGIAVIVGGVVGRSYVQDEVQKENIVGSDDMTPDATQAALREGWVTETALTTALYTSYFAENVALFAIISASRCCSSASASLCSPFSRAGAQRRGRLHPAPRPDHGRRNHNT
jgi:hypothetical protein